jgi:hypothetical protein
MGQLPEWASIAIMMNNYFHDVATALLAASAVLMIVLVKAVGDTPSPDVARFVVLLYPKMTLVAKVALVWILVGGVPRTLFFTRVELATGVGTTGIALALAVKHVIMFSLVALGAIEWRRLAKKYVELKDSIAR